jgi:topoisomerase IV subunit B
MDDLAGPQPSTTHDWAIAVDAGHLAHIRRDPARFAPGGVRHLVLEVVADAADEAAEGPGAPRGGIRAAPSRRKTARWTPGQRR